MKKFLKKILIMVIISVVISIIFVMAMTEDSENKKVQYLKMANVVGIRFIREAMREYENMQKYLQDRKQAGKLRRRIVRFWILQRKFVSISREEILDIFTRLYPRPVHFLWSAKKRLVK